MNTPTDKARAALAKVCAFRKQIADELAVGGLPSPMHVLFQAMRTELADVEDVLRAACSSVETREAIIEECAKYVEAEADSCIEGSAAYDQNWGFALQSCATAMRRDLLKNAAPQSEGTRDTGLPEAQQGGRADAATSPGRPAAVAAPRPEHGGRPMTLRECMEAEESAPLPEVEHHDPLLRHLTEWTKQVGEQPPSRVAPGIASCARQYHEKLNALPKTTSLSATTRIEGPPRPTHDEIVLAAQLYRSELHKRMDTRHPSASPSIESMTVMLRDLFDWMDARGAFNSPRSSVTHTKGPLTLDTDRQIFFYEQNHYYLSNFSAFKVSIHGVIFDTSEHAYHWMRFPLGSPERTIILESASAHDAFRFAQSHKAAQRPDWDQVKVSVMKEILHRKAEQHEYVRRKLLETGERTLVENSWRDPFWGWGPNRDGLNMLGKCWMQVRHELREALSASTEHKA